MRLYFAGPLFSSPEREWNSELAARLRRAGHEVFLPQDQETSGSDPAGIFAMDRSMIDWSEGLVAIMDGEDPDSGTAWECGYAFGTGKPVVLVRTDFRSWASNGEAPYNPMLTESCTIRLDLPTAGMAEVEAAILGALDRLADAKPG